MMETVRGTRHGRRVTVIAVLLAIGPVFMAGCGGSDSKSSGPDVSSADSIDAASNTPQPQATDSTDSSSAGGAEPVSSAGLPANFPTDRIPIPAEATITGATGIDGGDGLTFFVGFTMDGSVGDVQDYFDGVLDDKSWHKIIGSTTADGNFTSYASQEDGSGDIVSLTLQEVDGKIEGGLQVGITK